MQARNFHDAVLHRLNHQAFVAQHALGIIDHRYRRARVLELVVEDIAVCQARFLKHRDASVDHRRRAAEIGLHSVDAHLPGCQIVLLEVVRHQSAPAGPVGVFRLFVEHLVELQHIVRMPALLQRLDLFIQVKVLLRAGPVEEVAVPGNPKVHGMLDDGVNRAHARAARDADHVLVGWVQFELAERAGQGHFFANAISSRQPSGQLAPRHQADVERVLPRILRLRCASEGIRTRLADARDADGPELARLPDFPFVLALHHDLVGVVRQVPHALDPSPPEADTQGLDFAIRLRQGQRVPAALKHFLCHQLKTSGCSCLAYSRICSSVASVSRFLLRHAAT